MKWIPVSAGFPAFNTPILFHVKGYTYPIFGMRSRLFDESKSEWQGLGDFAVTPGFYDENIDYWLPVPNEFEKALDESQYPK